MKRFNQRTFAIHMADIKLYENDPLGLYYPWVIQIANSFPREEIAIGSLSLNDLIQYGYIGLIEAWNNVDHSRGQGEIWSFIKKRIKFAIRRGIDNDGRIIKIPRRNLEEARKNLSDVDKVLVNAFPKFFNEIEPGEWDNSSWESVLIGEIIDDYLYTHFKNIDHVEILRALFGIDREKKASIKELAIKYRKSEIGIKKIRERMLAKLRADETFKTLIENFYQN